MHMLKPNEKMLKQAGLSTDIINYIKTGENCYIWLLDQINEIKLAYENNIDPSDWCSPKYSAAQMRQLRYASSKGINYKPVLNPRYTFVQMSDILFAIENGIDYSSWLSLGESAMHHTRLDYERRLNDVNRSDV